MSLEYERPTLEGYSPGDDRNDCTIRATMAVTGLDYKTVYTAFRDAGRRRRRGCNTDEQRVAWKMLGYVFVKTDHAQRARTLQGLQRLLVKYDDTRPLLVYTKAHLTAFVNTRCIEYLAPLKRISKRKGTGWLEKIR